MEPVIGIDLGTTNSAAAVMTSAGPRLIPNALGANLTPSVVAVDDRSQVLVGAAAKELRVVEPFRCASIFKRHMGSDWSVELSRKRFRPEELSSLVLRSLKSDAEAFLNCEVKRAVITVPAYFNDQQRKATVAAGVIAGLDVDRILNEPTAAGIAYGVHQSNEDRTLLILDLGGGTFDVSVIECFEGSLEVKASSGESFLGGEDFTRAMAANILTSHKMPFERTEAAHPLLVARLLQQCEVAKCQLSTQDSALVRFPNERGELPHDAPAITVTRAELERWIAPTLARIELPIRRALGDANLKPDRIDEVILVGGATRMPAVVRRLRDLLDKEPQQRINPDEVVALGAAVQAGLVSRLESVRDLVVTDVAPFTLGVEITKQLGNELRTGYFLPIIDRNTTIPVSRVDRVGTIQANQKSIRVRVYQGESRHVQDNLLLGEFEVPGIPPGPAGQEVDIRLTYDLNGLLEVDATVVKTGRKVTHLITRHAKGMAPDRIRLAVADMARLKLHPREETVNRFLLRRAERLYQELALVDRQSLTDLLDGFESALNLQDAKVIEERRGELERFLDAHDSGEPGWKDDDAPRP
jgi:molecular chaperone HscC